MVELRKRKATASISANNNSTAVESRPRKKTNTAPKKDAANKASKDEPQSSKKQAVASKVAEPESKQHSKSKSKDIAETDQEMFWLMKAEPEPRLEKGVDISFSIDDLAAASVPEPWDGVRNPVARNVMREMKKGDLAFFYHSNCKTPGIAGILKIVEEATPDKSAHDPKHPYYDPKDSAESPKWSVVHVDFVRKFHRLISLKELQQYKAAGGELEELQTFRQTRLSVSKVTPEQWRFILSLLDDKDD